jgi:hypothetical protein
MQLNPLGRIAGFAESGRKVALNGAGPESRLYSNLSRWLEMSVRAAAIWQQLSERFRSLCCACDPASSRFLNPVTQILPAPAPFFCFQPLLAVLCGQTFGGDFRNLLFLSRSAQLVRWRGEIIAVGMLESKNRGTCRGGQVYVMPRSLGL